ncbi:Dioxygenase, ferredoxin subunit [archaeon GW2011_AR15]|nr:Dioxygenase, ferredoxin subunit [archaeon GW2011_AR15]MBS3104265.1 Rieske (2Fe-2S) protein [Candidatus Woesearchaeota archaeon]
MPFVKIGKTSDVQNRKGRLFIVNGNRVAVFNVNGEFFAIDSRCPHHGIDLAGGYLNGKIVTCPGHGWEFDLETGENVILPVSVRKYNIKSEGDNLLLEI